MFGLYLCKLLQVGMKHLKKGKKSVQYTEVALDRVAGCSQLNTIGILLKKVVNAFMPSSKPKFFYAVRVVQSLDSLFEELSVSKCSNS